MVVHMKKTSIKTKYIISGLIICLVSLAPVVIASYLISFHIAATQSTHRIEQTVLKNVTELDSWFRMHSDLVENTANDLQIVNNYNPDFLRRLLQSKYRIYHAEVFDYYIGFADSKKKFVSANGWAPPPDYDCRKRDWYQKAAVTSLVAFTAPYVDAQTGKMVITISRKLVKDGKMVGVLAADIFVDKVLGIIRDYRLQETGYAFLMDSNGNLLVHPKKEFQPSPIKMRNISEVSDADYSRFLQVPRGRAKVFKARDYDGKYKYFIFSKINSCGWTFGHAILSSEYHKPLRGLFYGFTFSVLISLLFAMVIMVQLINGMIRPIKSLNDTVNSFSTLRLDVRSKIDSTDELGELGRNFNHMADLIRDYSFSLEQKVADRTRELQEKNDRIMDSINYAKRLQQAILPSFCERLQIPAEDCFIIWKPRDRVGGDMYWCRGEADYALVAVADCTGHGVPGALMTMALCSILDGLPRTIATADPAQLLNIIHERLRETLGQNRNDSLTNDGADVALCLLDKQKRRIIFSGAKLSLFIGSSGQVMEYKGVRHSVGYAWGKKPRFVNQEIPWEPENILYLTTDGLLDQNMQKSGGGLGRTAFANFLKSITAEPLSKQQEALESLIADRLFMVEQRDDILVVGLVVR
jgi:serine phosphatase RsbU (regulator of sigma subunit)/HAMP domain-containing protein